MKKYNKIILAISTALLGIDIAFLSQNIDNINMIQFLGLAILVPCIMVSVMAASFMSMKNINNTKIQGLISAAAAIVTSVATAVFFKFNNNIISGITAKSNDLTNQTNFEISDVQFDNNFSSYIMIFGLVFTISMILNTIFKIYERKGIERNV